MTIICYQNCQSATDIQFEVNLLINFSHFIDYLLESGFSFILSLRCQFYEFEFSKGLSI